MSNRWRKAYRNSGIPTHEAEKILDGPKPKPGKRPSYLIGCTNCGNYHWSKWRKQRCAENKLREEIDASRPKAHPRRDKRGQGKPR